MTGLYVLKLNRVNALSFAGRLLGAALLVLSVAGCNPASRITTSAPGHQVTVYVEGNVSVCNQPTQTVVVAGPDRIMIERSRVLRNGVLWATIPEGASVSLRLGRHERSLSAIAETTSRSIKVE
jgi:hypothetical protein